MAMTAPINPFDEAQLDDYDEAQHLLQWYARLSESMRQRCVDTIIDNEGMLAFLRQATAHSRHSPGDFNSEVIIDLTRRMLEKLRQ
jgi:hypothetical protein